ncbi:PD40 domain-containing protein [Rufibacter sediminis]|uniref:PD40 domain-containing protein n=1 Tax=Rufibacter sediminis TaxID=2762756 RepID=A0ABR6VY79_9BACT|nr:PD40 domain-containing protein [Rufibacter sediminis]MBC3542147.1 PD40 domain-containing protein [Rufibacter sediminis]
MKFSFKQRLLLYSLGLWSVGAQAQGVPDTDVFLMTIKPQKEGLQVGTAVNITNRPGYDNQPSFTPDGKSILFTSQRDGQQTDIYQYIIASKKTQQLTHTPEAEYSPLVTPDGKSFSVVRGKEQHLWRFPLVAGSGQPASLLAMPQLIGYHVWHTPDTLLVAAFPDQPPMGLYLAMPSTKETVKLEENVGRSLHKVPGKQAISYLVPVSDSVAQIKQWRTRTGERETLIQALPGSQDYAWLPDGRLLMAQSAKLYLYKPGTDKRWHQVADFSKQGVKNITRLAVSPKGNHLSFVANQ